VVVEILPGVFHWETTHPRIGLKVSSYWLECELVVIDPLVPDDEGIAWFSARSGTPAAVLLSNRHHYRDSSRWRELFGCPILCNGAGLHEFTHGEQVSGFQEGDELPGGIVAERVGVLCPDETALYLPAHGALLIADAVVRALTPAGAGQLGFVPDSLMDDPPETKRGMLAALARLLAELDFEHLLLAHGGPLIGDGREQLGELIDSGGRTAFEL